MKQCLEDINMARKKKKTNQVKPFKRVRKKLNQTSEFVMDFAVGGMMISTARGLM